jgi:glycosyltransferase involved in cell wall biosynthesis
MKVLIAAAAFSSELSGVLRHAFNAARSLLICNEIRAVHLAVAPWQHKLAEDLMRDSGTRLVIHAAEMSRSSISRNAWYYHGLPLLARELSVDLVHLAYPVPVSARAFSCSVVVTLHDMYPYEIPDNFGFPKVLVNRAILRQCLHAVDGIAYVSETTREQIHRYLPGQINEKAVCIPNCILPMPEPVQPTAISWSSDPFLLCVAQHRRNKNIPLLLASFARLLRERRMDARTRLLTIGINGPETKRIHREVATLNLQLRTSFLSGLSDAELHWCYAHCEALIAPSSTEGFGLPIAEGLLTGCRIVCSDIEAHREIGSEHCHFVDLHGDAEQALANAIARALDEPRPSSGLGFVRLPQLSASAVGTQYLHLYRRLMETRSAEKLHKSQIAARGTQSTPSGERQC